MRETLSSIHDSRINIVSVPQAGFRDQLLKGVNCSATDLVVLSDDRVILGTETLKHLVAGFHDDSIGAVSVLQRVQSSATLDEDLTVWESFGALNIVRRNMLHCSLAFFNDGQVMNLSGRTVAYRTKILKDAKFQEAFTNDLWRGRYPLKTGDDGFITGWLYTNGWKTCMQKHKSAVITAGVNADWTYLKQLLRWSRDAARQYSRELAFAIKSRKLYHVKRSLLNIASNYATDFSVLMELFFLFLIAVAHNGHPKAHPGLPGSSILGLLVEHVAVSGCLTILEHAYFFDSTRRMLQAPLVIGYMYIHAFVVLYSVFTLNKVSEPQYRSHLPS
jgi:cellulose synthase/poly-beta-1,6-N-acetylglucosamine synthase-like glycosyltransferase